MNALVQRNQNPCVGLTSPIGPMVTQSRVLESRTARILPLEAVLRNGAVPLTVLKRLVDAELSRPH